MASTPKRATLTRLKTNSATSRRPTSAPTTPASSTSLRKTKPPWPRPWAPWVPSPWPSTPRTSHSSSIPTASTTNPNARPNSWITVSWWSVTVPRKVESIGWSRIPGEPDGESRDISRWPRMPITCAESLRRLPILWFKRESILKKSELIIL